MCVYNMRVAPGTHPSVGSYLWMECSHHQEFQLPFGNLRLSRLFFFVFKFSKYKVAKPPKNCFIWDKRPKLGLVKCLLHIPMSVRPSVGHTFEFAKCTHPTCVSYKLCKFINGIFDHYIRLIFPSPKFQISTGVYKFGLFVPKKRFS